MPSSRRTIQRQHEEYWIERWVEALGQRMTKTHLRARRPEQDPPDAWFQVSKEDGTEMKTWGEVTCAYYDDQEAKSLWKGESVSRLLITADCGGSNGARVRLWKVELQKLARELGLEISVCHLPPGTSKWNRIEHRLFSFISQNWRSKPLRSLATIISLIGATTTGTGLKVYCDRDTNAYPTGVKVSRADMAALDIRRDEFHGDWNYTLLPVPDSVAVIP